MSEGVWKRRDCVSAEVEGSLVLLDLEKLVYHSLNGTAAAVWQLLEEPSTEPAIVNALCERYEVTEDHCASSVKQLLNTLEDHNLVASVKRVTEASA